jgi:nitrate/TMAO reductase-like tetraheme cytochrome c subunit
MFMKEKGEPGKKRKKKFTKKTILIIMGVILIVGFGGGAGLIKASDNPAFCAACHNMEKYYASYDEEGLLANKHADAGVTCHDCHQDSMGKKIEEGVKYVTGDYETPMEKRDFGTREFCLDCHDFDEVKSKTDFEQSNPHDSHNGEQECNTCHNMHQESQVMCEECHTFDWTEELDEGWK